jgi:hypothetical protein
MLKSTRIVTALVAASLVTIGLPACGGGGGIPGDAVAQVGSTPLTKAALSEWMSSLAGGDFFELAGITLPKGLVSDPPNYAVCIADMKTLAPKLSGGQPRAKCELLDRSMRQQALTYLLSTQQTFDQAAELGLTVSNGEINQNFKGLQEERFPTAADLRQYLSARDWPLSVERFLLKRNLLSAKLTAALNKKFSSEKAQIAYLKATHDKLIAKTSCRPGYVVAQCKEYDAAKPPAMPPPPAALIQEVEAARPPVKQPAPAPDLECSNSPKGVVCEPVK